MQPAANLRLPISDCRFGKCLPKCRRFNNVFFKVQNGALTLRDVKNEGRSGYVYENTGDDDKMSGENTGFYMKMHPFHKIEEISS